MRDNYLRNKGKLSCNRIFFAGAAVHSTLINSVVMGTAGRMNATAHAAANHFEMMGTRFSFSSFFSEMLSAFRLTLWPNKLRCVGRCEHKYKLHTYTYVHICIFAELSDARMLATEAMYKRLSFIWTFVDVKIMTSRVMTIASHDYY